MSFVLILQSSQLKFVKGLGFFGVGVGGGGWVGSWAVLVPWVWGGRVGSTRGHGVSGPGAGEAADGVAFAVLWLFTSSLSHYLFNSGGGLIK